MSTPAPRVFLFRGKYRGEGAWIDIANESKSYRINQEIASEGNTLIVNYSHEFFQEGASSDGSFVFEFICPRIFTAKMQGAAVGNGYVFDDYLHFNIKAGEIFVETSYQRSGGTLIVRGSSTSNQQGRFIAWSEVLQAVD